MAAAIEGDANIRRRKGRPSGVADPLASADECQRRWAAEILSVMLGMPISPGDLDASNIPRTLTHACLWKAREIVKDIAAGRATESEYAEAFEHLKGGDKYKVFMPTPSMIAADAGAFIATQRQKAQCPPAGARNQMRRLQ